MIRLTILHTNDLHGRVEQVLRIAALARRIKQEVEANGGYCVLWDAGDAEDTILYESSMTKGRAMMALLRGAGYELEALGNATPLRYGPQTIAGLAEDFGHPLFDWSPDHECAAGNLVADMLRERTQADDRAGDSGRLSSTTYAPRAVRSALLLLRGVSH